MICKIRLRAIYRSNREVRIFCGIIAALALLPENNLRLGLENLKEIADEMLLRTIPLIEYVERVCRVRRVTCPVPALDMKCPPSDPSKGPLDQQPV